MKHEKYTLDNFFKRTTIHVRFRDLDPLNHVNNAVFNTYFEEARIDFIRAVPELNRSMGEGYSFVLAQLDLKYVNPVLFEESLIIGSSLLSIANSSVKALQVLFNDDGKIKAIAKTTGVWYDVAKKRPVRLPKLSNPEQYILSSSHG